MPAGGSSRLLSSALAAPGRSRSSAASITIARRGGMGREHRQQGADLRDGDAARDVLIRLFRVLGQAAQLAVIGMRSRVDQAEQGGVFVGHQQPRCDRACEGGFADPLRDQRTARRGAVCRWRTRSRMPRGLPYGRRGSRQQVGQRVQDRRRHRSRSTARHRRCGNGRAPPRRSPRTLRPHPRETPRPCAANRSSAAPSRAGRARLARIGRSTTTGSCGPATTPSTRSHAAQGPRHRRSRPQRPDRRGSNRRSGRRSPIRPRRAPGGSCVRHDRRGRRRTAMPRHAGSSATTSPFISRPRIASAPSLPPGSRVTTAWMPRSASAAATARACVDLPAPSPPSSEMKRPGTSSEQARSAPSRRGGRNPPRRLARRRPAAGAAAACRAC